MPISDQDKSAVIELFHDGMMTVDIARSVDLSRVSVWRITRSIERQNSPGKRPYYGGGRPRKINHRRACEMLKNGYTYQQIGLRHNVCASTVCQHFRRYGTDPSSERKG